MNSIDVIEFISRGFGGNLGQPNNASEKVLPTKLFYFENLQNFLKSKNFYTHKKISEFLHISMTNP